MTIELGGNIKLTGFKELDPAQLVVVKKMVGNYAKIISEKSGKVQELNITLKKVHNNNHELMGKLIIKDKTYNSEITDFNLFFALDKILNKLQSAAK